MASCKTCKKEYHACVSCGMEDWEYTWCNANCRKISENQIGLKQIINKLFNVLTKQEKVILSDAFIERDDNETLFEYYLMKLKYLEGDID